MRPGTSGPEKRAAIESPAQLVERERGSGATVTKRPISTVLGALFVFGRAGAGLLWILSFWLLWPEISAEIEVENDSADVVLAIVLGLGSIGVLVLLVLGVLIWRGSTVARILVMSGLTLSVVSSALNYFASGEEITIRTTLIVLALDILVLLALSSRDSRAWARRQR